MTTGKIKGWANFQHYKNRAPPWIKLHRSFLDNYEFSCLPVASKALAPMIWLLAAESSDGSVRIDTEWLAFRLRWPEADVVAGLKPLCDGGFIVVASALLAECLQVACLEGEGETETEGEKKSSPRKSKKAKAPETLITEWADSLGDEPAISADDTIFGWAAAAGIPSEWIEIAWWVFEARYADGDKTYADWRAVFRKAVREDWLKVWRHDARENRFVLTTAGETARREMGATA